MPTEKPPPGANTSPGTSMEEIRAMLGEIATGQASTNTKIDTLSANLSSRLTKAENNLAGISTQLTDAMREVEEIKHKSDRAEKDLPDLVERIVARHLATPAGQRPRSNNRRGRPASEINPVNAQDTPLDDMYWNARKSLRIWPVPGTNLTEAVLAFLRVRLLCAVDMISGGDLGYCELFFGQTPGRS